MSHNHWHGGKSEPKLGHDSSTNNLIRRYRKNVTTDAIKLAPSILTADFSHLDDQ